MIDFGKTLVLFGAMLLVVGILFLLFSRTNLPIGRLPGDIVYRGKNTIFYFPLATSILVSLVLTVIFNLVGGFRH